MSEQQSTQTKNDGTRHWQGALTIQRVVVLKQELFQGLDGVDRLVLNLSAVTEIDPACLQLLCSGHRTATKLNKELALVGASHLADTFRAAGFVRHVGCALDCNRNCLWVPQENSTPGLPR
ncbi:MAG: STAS domain-containing protein [Desulfuromonadales bacterium]